MPQVPTQVVVKQKVPYFNLKVSISCSPVGIIVVVVGTLFNAQLTQDPREVEVGTEVPGEVLVGT